MKTIIRFILVFPLLWGASLFAQSQRIAYVDTEYILSNLPAWSSAVRELDTKAKGYQSEVDQANLTVEKLRRNLQEENILLTSEMIRSREEEIDMRRLLADELARKYFGTEGQYVSDRRMLCGPIQDQMFNIIRDIAQKRRFDIVLDRSGDIVIAYVNEKLNISELVLEQLKKL